MYIAFCLWSPCEGFSFAKPKKIEVPNSFLGSFAYCIFQWLQNLPSKLLEEICPCPLIKKYVVQKPHKITKNEWITIKFVNLPPIGHFSVFS